MSALIRTLQRMSDEGDEVAYDALEEITRLTTQITAFKLSYSKKTMNTLNLPEAAELMKIHPKTLQEFIYSGSLPAAKIGRSWVMLESDVLNYIETQIAQQTAQRSESTRRNK